MATAADRNKDDYSGRLAHRDAVNRFLVSMLGDRALADDLTQETFLRAERTSAPYLGRASVKTWLFSIALNLARDHFRAMARHGTGVDLEEAASIRSTEPSAEFAAMQREMASCIGRYVLQLPARQRDVVALHDMGGLGHAEIAAHLGISAGNARVVLNRGRAALRRLLEEHCILSFDDSIPCEPRPRGR